jgi:phosphoglycolate phosphatase-like HAD superfamily hydrolase
MQAIEGILFEPAGSLAEFPAKPWGSELEAVDRAALYPDVLPALGELKALGVHLCIASSLSRAAIERFLEIHSLGSLFAAVAHRDNSVGDGAGPLLKALELASLDPARTICLTDTLAGIETARAAGVHPVLMMNDPDEAKRLAEHEPAGGVVSLLELPDFVRFVAASQGPVT